MLSTDDIQTLSKVARISLRENEVESFCRDLNALLEMVSVLDPLPKENPGLCGTQGLEDMRTDQIEGQHFSMPEESCFSVPRVMEKT